MKTFKLIGAGLLAIVLCFTFSSCSKDDDEGGNNRFPVSEYAVDLGLPSGTLWADRNIGANSPEGYGDYFAWGETEPKDNYYWSTYKWCKGSNDTMTKYCTERSYGYKNFTDTNTTIELADDAATANWGEKWCMPTYDQLSELRSKCTWTWTTQGGVNGYKVTGPNSKSIFLPAAGYRASRYLSYSGSDGYYWSRDLYDYKPDGASCLDFNSEGRFLGLNNGRCYGYSVRAVVR